MIFFFALPIHIYSWYLCDMQSENTNLKFLPELEQRLQVLERKQRRKMLSCLECKLKLTWKQLWTTSSLAKLPAKNVPKQEEITSFCTTRLLSVLTARLVSNFWTSCLSHCNKTHINFFTRHFYWCVTNMTVNCKPQMELSIRIIHYQT